ncbi:MAG: Hpt domain-containing protein [Desulfitobacteriaceae bacterium]
MSQDENKTQSVDLGEFLEFYLLDSQEQIEKLGAGLLQLEKEGGNIGLINDLFRSAHSLKGASGTMGFTPIVALTHAAEDLLDRLRQGKIDVSMDMIDLLLAVTDRVKVMLAQVERRQDLSTEYEDLVIGMKELLNAKPTNSENPGEITGEITGEIIGENFIPLNFELTSSEWEKVNNAQIMGHVIYQVDVVLAPKTLMKAVRAVMAMQKVESIGTVAKILPSIEELEAGNSEEFSLLIISDEPQEEISQEILSVSEIIAVVPHIYPLIQSPMEVAATLAPLGTEAVGFVEQAISDVAKETCSTSVEQIKLNNPKEQGVQGVSNTAQTAVAVSASEEGNTQVHTIRVETSRMDNLINLVGEIVITRTRLVQIGLDLKEQHQMDPLVSNLNETNVYLGRLMNDLQESVMRLRMVPIGTVFSRFPRLVRDL